jgi:hypothetical protein
VAQRLPSPTEAQRRPYYADYSHTRRSIHSLCTSHYLDLFITFIICLNVITMSMEHYNQPKVASWGQGGTGKRVPSREGRGHGAGVTTPD